MMGRSIVPEAIARQPWHMLVPLTGLVSLGAAVLYSAAGGSLQPYALSHVVRFFIFLVMAIVISRISRDFFRMAAYPVYGAIVVLLVLVEAIGAVGGGSQRWLNLGFITLQPSELMKPAIVLVLALVVIPFLSPLGGKLANQGLTNEAGGAGDENTHGQIMGRWGNRTLILSPRPGLSGKCGWSGGLASAF